MNKGCVRHWNGFNKTCLLQNRVCPVTQYFQTVMTWYSEIRVCGIRSRSNLFTFFSLNQRECCVVVSWALGLVAPIQFALAIKQWGADTAHNDHSQLFTWTCSVEACHAEFIVLKIYVHLSHVGKCGYNNLGGECRTTFNSVGRGSEVWTFL